MIDDSKAARWRWGSGIEGVCRNTKAIHNVRHGLCESCRAETSIESNDKSLIRSPSCYEISSNGFCTGSNVRERETIGGDRPPTVGTEFDVWMFGQSEASPFSAIISLSTGIGLG